MSDEDRKERKGPEEDRVGAGTGGAAGGKTAGKSGGEAEGKPQGEPQAEPRADPQGKPETGPDVKTGGGDGDQAALSAEARKARAKEERLAEALRANLRRRKSAAKSRRDG